MTSHTIKFINLSKNLLYSLEQNCILGRVVNESVSLVDLKGTRHASLIYLRFDERDRSGEGDLMMGYSETLVSPKWSLEAKKCQSNVNHYHQPTVYGTFSNLILPQPNLSS